MSVLFFVLAHLVLQTIMTPSLAQATTTLQSVSGVTRSEGSGTTYNLYAGFAYDNVADTPATYNCSTSTCNTCTASSQFGACNFNSVFVNGGTLQFSLVTDNSAATATNWLVCDSSNADKTGTFTINTATSTQYVITGNWTDVCGNLLGNSSSCTSTVVKFSIGFGGSCSSLTEKIDFTVNLSNRIGTTTMADADSTTTSAYDFSIFPGDGKIYIENFKYWTGYPSISGVSYKWTGLYFFYEKNNGVPVRSSDHSSLININSSGEADKDFVDNLENGTDYCFRLANVDTTGNILFFSPTTIATNDPLYCGKPQEVVGLLSDKKCFIATAAFGSNLDPHVTSFRQFRNQYLLQSDLGKWFVKTYYKFSPTLAHWISESDLARTITRGFLWPLLGFIEIALTFGMIPALCCLLIGLMMAKIILQRFPRLPSFRQKEGR